MKKIIWLLVLISLLCVGCSSDSAESIYKSDKKIAAEYNTFGLDNAKQSIDGQIYLGTLTMEGMDTVWTYEADSDSELELSYLLTVTSGKAKLAFISPDGRVTTIVENSDKSTQADMETTTISITKGINRIKLVAVDKPTIELKLEASVGTLVEMGM